MYQWKINSTLLVPLALSVSISHILYSGNAFAKKYELNFIGKSADKGVSIKDTITQDNQYDFAVKVDNPDLRRGMDLRFVSVMSPQRSRVLMLSVITR